MKPKMLLFPIVAALLLSAAAYAHHSFAATYNTKAEVKVEGRLAQFVFRNPHSFVYIEAPDPTGEMQRWAIEWSGTSSLGSQGVTQRTLKVGDHVIVTGRPSRTPGEYRVQMLTLRRPADGLTWGNRAGEVVD
jgi:hypothetical protein